MLWPWRYTKLHHRMQVSIRRMDGDADLVLPLSVDDYSSPNCVVSDIAVAGP